MGLKKRKYKLERKLEKKLRIVLSDNELRNMMDEIVDILYEIDSSRFCFQIFDDKRYECIFHIRRRDKFFLDP